MSSVEIILQRPATSVRGSAAATAVLALAACAPPPPPAPPAPLVNSNAWFVEATAEFGIDYRHASGATGQLHMPEIMGSGMAAFDADGDGDVDLYFVSGNGALPAGQPSPGVTNHFYRNDGGHFVNATATSGLGDMGYGMGAAVGDADNDGDLDVYVTNVGPDQLYLNDGTGTFAPSMNAATKVDGWSCSAAFLDYDRDGLLDLYITRYIAWTPRSDCYDHAGRRDYCMPGPPYETDVLLHNEGRGVFTDASESAGIAAIAAPGLGLACRDFDGDGWIDIYVANDAEANQLWVNQRDGTFRDDGVVLGVALNHHGDPEAGMGVVGDDLDGDGDTDLYLTHTTAESNTFYRNERSAGGTGFLDRTGPAGLAASSMTYTGFGSAGFDADLDGDLDLAIANGRVQRTDPRADSDAPEPWDRYAEPNLLYLNDGNANFTVAAERGGDFVSHVEVSRGLAAVDLDEDGDQDLVVVNTDGPVRIYRNVMPDAGNWIRVRAIEGDRDAIGARIVVQLGGRVRLRWIGGGSSYLVAGDLAAHVGLGDATSVDAIFVRWNDGEAEQFDVPEINRTIELRRGQGVAEGGG